MTAFYSKKGLLEDSKQLMREVIKMENTRQVIISLFQPFEEKTFIHMKHCNYIGAFTQFLEQHDITLEKNDILEGERTSYIDRYGVFKYKNVLKIKSLNLKVQISCYHQKDWEFQFDAVLPNHLPIAKERIIETDEKTVFLTYMDEEKQTHFYAIPVPVAETLDVEEFHEKNIEIDVKKELLLALEPYKIPSMILLKP